LYVTRRGLEVEVRKIECIIPLRYLPLTLAVVQIGFINSNDERAQHGVRYLISPEPEGSPYRIGRWIPLSTSDLGSGWGGSEVWVRGQGAAVTKAIWFHRHFDRNIEVSWSGMTAGEKQDLDVWLKERAEQHATRRKIQREEYEARKAKYGEKHNRVEQKRGMQAYYKSRMACRAECGEQHPTFSCSKCKIARESLVFPHCSHSNEVAFCKILQPGLSIGGLEGELLGVLVFNPSHAYWVHSIIKLTVERKNLSPQSALTPSGSRKNDRAPSINFSMPLPCLYELILYSIYDPLVAPDTSYS
jgi:hypothetical protein